MHQPLTFDGNVRVHGWGDRQEITATHICKPAAHFALPAMHQPLTFDGNVRVHGWGDRQGMTATHICEPAAHFYQPAAHNPRTFVPQSEIGAPSWALSMCLFKDLLTVNSFPHNLHLGLGGLFGLSSHPFSCSFTPAL